MQQTMGPIQGFYGLGGVTKFTFNGVGKAWFVDSVNGEDSHSFGKTWNKAFKTITEAVDHMEAGDTLYMKGSFNESVSCDLEGVRFVGVGTGPYQATWTAPTVVGSYCLKMAAAAQRVENIRFRPVAYTTSGIPSGIQLSGAAYGQIVGCRFMGKTGSYKAIYSPVCDSDNVLIEGNEFIYMNTATHGAAIFGVEAGGLSYSGWQIRRNIFNSCVTAIDINGRVCVLEENIIMIGGISAAAAVGAVCTMGIDLSGTSSGGNMVTRNTLGGAYTTALYVPGAANDCWFGNYVPITSTTAPYGLSVANPTS